VPGKTHLRGHLDMEVHQLNVRADLPDADAEELDQETRELLAELRDLPVESAELIKSGPAPQGTKGLDPAAAEIAVMVGTASLKLLIEYLMSKRTKISFEGRIGGGQVKFEGPAKDFARLLATFAVSGTEAS
jgi:hypothetical protein